MIEFITPICLLDHVAAAKLLLLGFWLVPLTVFRDLLLRRVAFVIHVLR